MNSAPASLTARRLKCRPDGRLHLGAILAKDCLGGVDLFPCTFASSRQQVLPRLFAGTSREARKGNPRGGSRREGQRRRSVGASAPQGTDRTPAGQVKNPRQDVEDWVDQTSRVSKATSARPPPIKAKKPTVGPRIHGHVFLSLVESQGSRQMAVGLLRGCNYRRKVNLIQIKVTRYFGDFFSRLKD
jgi:hypothetical protein